MATAKKPRRSTASVPDKLAGVSSAAVQKATGKTWPEWVALLDAENALERPHREIATLLATKHQVPDWWSQMVTVGYEQARGRRVVGQKCSGDFAASASKTFPVAAPVLHGWFSNAKKRARWLDETIVLRTATAPKSARLGFPDGSIAGAWITVKGAAKSSVGISHDGLPDAGTAARHKAFWQAALARLEKEIAGAASLPAE